MEPDNKTAKVARHITDTIDSQDTTILVPESAKTGDGQSYEVSDKQKTGDKDSKSGEHADKKSDLGGYSVGDLAMAPVKPPEPNSTEDSQATSNNKVVFLVAGALLLFIVGIIVAVVGLVAFGIALIVIAALLVIIGVFLPIGQGAWNKQQSDKQSSKKSQD